MVFGTSLQRCRDLSAVARLVARDRRFRKSMRRLKKTKAKEQFLLLSAPATVALCLDEANVLWPGHRPLRILILGTRSFATLDDAEWFRFLPPMLDCERPLELVVCQDAVNERRKSQAQHCLQQSHRIGTVFDDRDIETILSDPTYRRGCVDDEPTFDLAISFNDLDWGPPLFENLKRFRRAQVPVYLTSYSETVALLRHAILRAHRAEAEPVAIASPFALVSARAGENWNRVISKIVPENLPSDTDEYDTAYAATLTVATAVVLNSHKDGHATQEYPVGALVRDQLVHTVDGYGVHLDSHIVRELATDDEVGRLDAKWHEIVDAYEADWDEVDRLVWASHIRFYASADGLIPSVSYNIENPDASHTA